MKLSSEIKFNNLCLGLILFIILCISSSNTCKAQSLTDSAFVYLEFLELTQNQIRSGLSTDEKFFKLTSIRDTLISHCKTSQQKYICYQLFEKIFSRIKPELQHRIEDINKQIIHCMVGQKHCISDSIQKQEINDKITPLLEEGIEMVFTKYKKNNYTSYRNNLDGYIDFFQKHDPNNQFFKLIKGQYRFHRIKYLLITFILLLIFVFIITYKKFLISNSTIKNQKNLFEIISVWGFGFIIFNSFFLGKEYQIFILVLSVLLLLTIITQVVSVMYTSNSKILINNQYVSIIAFVLGTILMLLTRQWEVLISLSIAFGLFLCMIFLIRGLNFNWFLSLVLIHFIAFIIYHDKSLQFEFGEAPNYKMLMLLTLLSTISFFFFSKNSTFLTVRGLSLFYLLLLSYWGSFQILSFPNENFSAAGFGIIGIVSAYLLFSRSFNHLPISMTKAYKVNSQFINRKNLIAHVDKLMGLVDDFTFIKFGNETNNDILDVKLIRCYLMKTKIEEKALEENLNQKVNEFHHLLEKKSYNLLFYWMKVVLTLADETNKIKVLDFMTNRHSSMPNVDPEMADLFMLIPKKMYDEKLSFEAIDCMKKIISFSKTTSNQLILAKLYASSGYFAETLKILTQLKEIENDEYTLYDIYLLEKKIQLLSEPGKINSNNEILRAIFESDYKRVCEIEKSVQNCHIEYAKGNYSTAIEILNRISIHGKFINENRSILSELNGNLDNALKYRKMVAQEKLTEYSRFWNYIWISLLETRENNQTYATLRKYYDER